MVPLLDLKQTVLRFLKLRRIIKLSLLREELEFR